MCDLGAESEWNPIGVTTWGNDLVELQQCEYCDDRRSVVLDPDAIPVYQESAPDDHAVDGESEDSESRARPSGQSDGPWGSDS